MMEQLNECVMVFDYLYAEELHNLTMMVTQMQGKIGLKLFMEGQIIKVWSHIQEIHFRNKK